MCQTWEIFISIKKDCNFIDTISHFSNQMPLFLNLLNIFVKLNLGVTFTLMLPSKKNNSAKKYENLLAMTPNTIAS